MNWSRERIVFNNGAYSCSKSDIVGGSESRKLLDELRLSKSGSSAAIFIQWLPAKLRPIDENDLSQGYVSDDDPDAHVLWIIDDCSFEESLDFAFFHLKMPKQDVFKRPDYGWRRTKGFLQGIKEFSNLRLDFVCEWHIGFSFCLSGEACKKEVYLHILKYKKENFQYDGDESNDRWLFNIFNKENRFSLGLA